MARIMLDDGLRAGTLAIAGLLAGCAPQATSSRLAAAPPPAPVAMPRPMPPAGASADLAIPPLGPDGAYRTINRDLSPAAAVWHVRSALNVAALGCRGPDEATIVANYNALLATKRSPLAAAYARTEAESRARFGKQWRGAHDQRMTRIYNFFAQPPAKQRFCAVALAVGAQAATIAPAAFEAFAVTALAELEAPFTDFYRAYDGYRRDLAAWEGDGRNAAPAAAAATVMTIAYAAPADAASRGRAAPDRRLAAADLPRTGTRP